MGDARQTKIYFRLSFALGKNLAKKGFLKANLCVKVCLARIFKMLVKVTYGIQCNRVWCDGAKLRKMAKAGCEGAVSEGVQRGT
jgi:hypothetical protein